MSSFCLRILLIAFVSLLAGGVYNNTRAAAAPKHARKRVAVLSINHNNVPPGYAKIVRNSIEYVLFSTDDFNLLERQHIDKVIRERKLLSQSVHNTGSAVRIGRSLATDFIILGSIDRLDTYKITMRVVSVHHGKIVAAYAKDFKDANSVDFVVNKLTRQLARDIKQFILTGKIKARFFDFHNIVLGTRFGFLYPVGALGGMVSPGYGVDLRTGLDNLLTDNTVFCTGIGYYRFKGNTNSDDSAILVPLSISLGYRYFLLPRVYLLPEIKSGINISILKHGSGNGFDMNEHTTSYGYSPLMGISLILGFRVREQVAVEFGAGYAAVLEKGDTMMHLDAFLGAEVLF